MVIARRNPVARAFTLIELIAVIVVLAILSGIAIPKYFDYAAQAKASSCKGTLGGVRSAIASFYSKSSLNAKAFLGSARPRKSALLEPRPNGRGSGVPVVMAGGTALPSAPAQALS